MSFRQGPFGTGVEKAHMPALPSSPVLSEWLALAQGQPCDLSLPGFPSVLRVEGLGIGILRHGQNHHMNWI